MANCKTVRAELYHAHDIESEDTSCLEVVCRNGARQSEKREPNRPAAEEVKITHNRIHHGGNLAGIMRVAA